MNENGYDSKVSKIVVRLVNDDSIKLVINLLSRISWFDVYVQNNNDDKFKKCIEFFMWAVNSAFLLCRPTNMPRKTSANSKLKRECDQY